MSYLGGENWAKDPKWPQPGQKMMFTGEGGYEREVEYAKTIFKIGGIYEVANTDVQPFSHSVAFVGITGRYNGCMFELITTE